jgi:ABC-2 type transport system permease protein
MVVNGNEKYKFLFKRIIQLYALYAKMDLAWLFRDTKLALLCIFTEFIANLGSIGSIYLLAIKFNGVGGMNKYEVLFMLGYVTINKGVFSCFCAGNNGHISRIVGRGQLEHIFIQPLPISVQLSTMGFFPFTSGLTNIISGSVIIGIALQNLGIQITWWWVLSLIFNILISITIILSQSYLFASTTFYAPVAAEEISSYVIGLNGDLSTYPLSGMPIALQIPLITIIPAGLLAWFPSLALLGKPPLNLPYLFPMFIAIILFLLANFTFRKGLKYYVKKGSTRYSAMGHRN